MASTKIINVLKDDKFEEILGLLKETSAKEVIFVLPKTSRAFKKEENFLILANEAGKSNKKISLLCSNPDINTLAKQFKFDVLLAKNDSKPSLIKTVNQFDKDDEDDEVAAEPAEEDLEMEDEEDVEESAEEDDDETEDDYDEVSEEDEDFEEDSVISPKDEDEDEEDQHDDEDEEEVVVPIKAKFRGGLEGIIRNHDAIKLNVRPQKEKAVTLGVRKKLRKGPSEDIKAVWNALPGGRGSRENSIWSNFASERQPRAQVAHSRKLTGFRLTPKKGAVLFGGISILILGSIIFVSTGSAKIAIQPKKQPLILDMTVLASDIVSAVDSGANKIPGQLFSIDKTVSKTFESTGEKDVIQKARGMITVYNNYGTTPQILIATTRFEKDGLIFRSLKTVTVPGMTVENGQTKPGKVSVEVVADKAGETYNLEAGKFTIPAFQERLDADRFQKIYAESTQSFKGGVSGRAKVVTEDDYNAAKTELKSQLEKEIGEGLKLQAAGLKTLGNITIHLGEPESTAKIDEAADSFTMTWKGSIKTVGFKEEDLRELARVNIDKNKNLQVIPEKIKFNYISSSLKEDGGSMEMKINLEADGYAKVDLAKIKKELAGKKEDDIKSYLRGVSGVESAKVILSPFWVGKIPKDDGKTSVEIEY